MRINKQSITMNFTVEQLESLYEYVFNKLDRHQNGDEKLTNSEYLSLGNLIDQIEKTGLVNLREVNTYANIYGD